MVLGLGHARGHNAAERPRREPRGTPALILGVAVLLAVAGCSLANGNTGGSGRISARGPSGHAATNAVTIRIRVLKGQDNSTLVLVPVYIHRQGPYPFILDTGASISLIEQTLAQQLHLAVVKGSQQVITGVGGSRQVVLVTIDEWEVGSVPLPKTLLASTSVPGVRLGTAVRGLLGSDIWSTFGKFTLDYAASTLTIYNVPSAVLSAQRQARRVATLSGALPLAWPGAARPRRAMIDGRLRREAIVSRGTIGMYLLH